MIENQEKLMNAHDIEAFKAALEAKEQDMSYILQLSNVDEKLVEVSAKENPAINGDYMYKLTR